MSESPSLLAYAEYQRMGSPRVLVPLRCSAGGCGAILGEIVATSRGALLIGRERRAWVSSSGKRSDSFLVPLLDTAVEGPDWRVRCRDHD